MDGKSAKEILRKYREGKCTPEEIAWLESWYLSLNAETEVPDAEQLLTATNRVERRLDATTRPNRRPKVIRWTAYAAAVLPALAVGILLVDRTKPVADQPQVVKLAAAPGGNKATLKLADGRELPLRENQPGIIVGTAAITYEDGTQLAVANNTDIRSPVTLPTGRQTIHQLTTPKGGTYQVTLSDGTKVWLNAVTRLSYPSRFKDDERIVELDGEAFFEVAPSTTPFRVVSRGQHVEVLGTAFNVSAYAEDSETATTLINGAVRIVNLRSNAKRELEPGEQGIVHDTNTSTRSVNVDRYVAWKEGLFHFEHTDPKTAFDQIGRWYDMDVRYNGRIPRTHFYGIISRDQNLTDVLDIFRESGLRFELIKKGDKRTLVVFNES